MQNRVIIKKNIGLARCPSCREIASLKKSKTRGILELIVKLFFFRPYTCKECGWRGEIFKYKLAKNGFKTMLLYLGLIILSALIMRIILKSFFPV